MTTKLGMLLDPFATPQYQYRASEFGACIKRLAADRMGLKRSEGAYDSMKPAFERGNAHEEACKAVMRAEGWVLETDEVEAEGGGKGMPISLAVSVNGIEYSISGHLDGMVKPPNMLEALPLAVGEMKAPGAYERFISEMYVEEPSALVELYKWQTSIYMHAKQTELYMITLDDQFKLHYHGIEEPFYSLDDIKNRIGDVEEIVAGGTLPKLCSIRNFPCPFYHLHEDEEMEYVVDSMFDDLIRQRAAWKHEEAEVKKALKDINARILENMQGDAKKATEMAQASVGTRKTTTYDVDRMRKDGIPVDEYKSESESDPFISNAKWKGKE